MTSKRRTRRIVNRPVLPKYHSCPSCGKPLLIKLIRDEELALVKCHNCGLEDEIEFRSIYPPHNPYGKVYQGITKEDIYGALIDRFQKASIFTS